jgi:hypothetical protein
LRPSAEYGDHRSGRPVCLAPWRSCFRHIGTDEVICSAHSAQRRLASPDTDSQDTTDDRRSSGTGERLRCAQVDEYDADIASPQGAAWPSKARHGMDRRVAPAGSVVPFFMSGRPSDGLANGVRLGHAGDHLRQPVCDLVDALSDGDQRWWEVDNVDGVPFATPCSRLQDPRAAVVLPGHRSIRHSPCGRGPRRRGPPPLDQCDARAGTPSLCCRADHVERPVGHT